MPSADIAVIKATGEREPFSEAKVRRSIRRARIPRNLEDEVVGHVKEILYDQIPTLEIYKHIREFLGKSASPYMQGRYGLKQAIMQLGPSGFPFEKFIAKILEHYGYKTETGVIAKGECVEHEVDVIATKNGKRYMLECKFHNRPGARSDVKVALYVQARFEDLMKTGRGGKKSLGFDQPWIVTNTKFTTEAITYGNCVGMFVLGWSHPEQGDLQSLIEPAGLHPVTCMSSLTQEQIKELFNKNIVLCKQLIEEKQALKQIGISSRQRQTITREAIAICRQSGKNHEK